MSRPLVVAAVAAEATYVPDGLRLLVSGIGKVESASAVAEAIAAERPSVVLNIGTAGSLDGRTGLFCPSVALNHDFSSEAIRFLGGEAVDEVTIPGGDGTVLATGDVFVSDPALRDALARRAGLVDMEGFAVARACQRAGVPVRLVKHVSDHADETATDWPAQVDASARALGDWLRANALL
ncbi:MAG: nucleosidase [Aeromicrobium sp.]|uniref:nucleosidase n=1 Tax=Aeromicrobium sp. TaxID=1871063 RepID=UPI0039E52ADD